VEWVPDKSIRNEPLDLAVLCRAAAAVCGIDRFSDEDWAALEGNMQTDPPRASRDDKFWGQRDSNWLGGKNWFK
jgi:phage terminase large subunit GpA-like protein